MATAECSIDEDCQPSKKPKLDNDDENKKFEGVAQLLNTS